MHPKPSSGLVQPDQDADVVFISQTNKPLTEEQGKLSVHVFLKKIKSYISQIKQKKSNNYQSWQTQPPGVEENKP